MTSRPKRWAKACSEAIDAAVKLEGAMSELVDIQSEYSDWLDNLPDDTMRVNSLLEED